LLLRNRNLTRGERRRIDFLLEGEDAVAAVPLAW
jgi:hypothetical protein